MAPPRMVTEQRWTQHRRRRVGTARLLQRQAQLQLRHWISRHQHQRETQWPRRRLAMGTSGSAVREMRKSAAGLGVRCAQPWCRRPVEQRTPHMRALVAADVQSKGSDQAGTPGAHLSEGVTGMEHVVSLKGVTGDFTATQATAARVPKTKDHHVRIHGDDALPKKMQMPLDERESVARRYGTSLLAHSGSAYTALMPNTSIAKMRTAADTIACGLTRVWTFFPQRCRHGSCHGNGDLNGNISRTSIAASASATLTGMPIARMRTNLGRTSRPAAADVTRARRMHPKLALATHRKGMAIVRCAAWTLRSACMPTNGPPTRGTAKELLAKFGGGLSRLGGRYARLPFMQAVTVQLQLEGKESCLGRPPTAAALPAATAG